MSTPGELLEALGREARARFGSGGEAATRIYRGRSVDELVPQIQRELGADAIIVRRREGLTGGVLGFFQRTYVEIEAMPGSASIDLYDEATSIAPPAPPAAADPAQQPGFAPNASFAPNAAFAADGQFEPDGPFVPDAAPAVAAGSAPGAGFAPAAPGYASSPAPGYTPQGQYAAPAPPAAGSAAEQLAASASTANTPAAGLQAGAGSLPGAGAEPPGASPPPAPALPQRPMLGYAPVRPNGSSSAPGATPHPFFTREQAAPSPRAGSAYVTAHLAALARANPAKLAPSPPAARRAVEPAPWSPSFPHAADGREPGPLEAPELFPATAASVGGASTPPWSPGERREVAPGSQGRARAGVARSLRRCGIGEELAEELLDSASAHALALDPRAGLVQAVRATLAQRIPVAPPLPSKGAVIAVVGAGGSGKTTCCASLLGAYRKGSSLPASFATLTREGERRELQLVISPYIMKPSAAGAPRALRALRRARSAGMAVLDTPSTSPSDRAGVRDLARLLTELKPERVVVALPATLGATAAAQLLQALRPLGANALAVTHADETDQLGVAVEAACRFGLAPEYMLERGRGGGWRLRQLAPSVLAERLLP
jgi:hypothetical protein